MCLVLTVSVLQTLTLILSAGLVSWEVYNYQINLILQMLFAVFHINMIVYIVFIYIAFAV